MIPGKSTRSSSDFKQLCSMINLFNLNRLNYQGLQSSLFSKNFERVIRRARVG